MVKKHLVSAAILLLASLTLAGCAKTPLSGAASMRVEVDVYKGPLSRDPEVQVGEFIATLNEASEAIDVLDRFERPPQKGVSDPLWEDLRDVQIQLGIVRAAANAWYRDFYRYANGARKTGIALPYDYPNKLQLVPIAIYEIGRSQVQSLCPRYNIQEKISFAMTTLAYPDFTRLHEELTSCSENINKNEQLKNSGIIIENYAKQIDSLRNAIMNEVAFDSIPVFNQPISRERKIYAYEIENALDKLNNNTCVEKIALEELRKSSENLSHAAFSSVSNTLYKNLTDCKNPQLKKEIIELRLNIDQTLSIIKTGRPILSKIGVKMISTGHLGSEELLEQQMRALKNQPAFDQNDAETIKVQLQQTLVAAAQVAQVLRAKAQFWAYANIGYRVANRETRRDHATVGALFASYADRIGQRSDTLLQQLRGNDRLDLPLSIALRETSPSAYLKQYIWNDAIPDPNAAFDDGGRDRVRAIEQLSSDENWTNVNTVYASGRGTVRMALIKDEIGNWNLKSFDQDPSKLLEAYRDAGVATFKTAASLASQITNPAGASMVSITSGLADKLAFGGKAEPEPLIGVESISGLRERFVTQLNEVSQRSTARAKELDDAIGADDSKGAKADLKAAKAKQTRAAADEKTALDLLTKATADKAGVDQARATYSEKVAALADANQTVGKAEAKLTTLTAQRETLPLSVVAEGQQILSDYEKLLILMQNAAVERNKPATSIPSNPFNRP